MLDTWVDLTLNPTGDLYTDQLDRILQYMDKLNTLNTEGIEPTNHAIPLDCLLREDFVARIF